MFVFLMAFMSSDAWQNFSNARSALINESSAISRLASIQFQHAEHQKTHIANLQTYLEAVLNEEWGKSFNDASSPKAKEVLDKISRNIWKGTIDCLNGTKKQGICIDSFTNSSLIKAHDDLRNAREQKLSLGYLESVNTKWLLAIFLAFISALSVAAVHRSNQKTGMISLVLFCGSIWVSFSIVTMYSNPYKWAERIEPVPLSSLLQDLKSIQQ